MLSHYLWLNAASASLASAAVFTVSVGANGNSYTPSTITAQIGDTVRFDFNSVLHDVVQSSANAPCAYTSGFYSTQQSNSNASFAIAIADTQPKYFFCSVSNHCNVGMVGVINPSNVTQSDFARNARSAQVTAPRGSAIVGGNLTIGSTTTTPSPSSGVVSNGSSPSPTSSTTTNDGLGSRSPQAGWLLGAVLLFFWL